MSRRKALFADIQLGPGSPYAERADQNPRWPDRVASALYTATLAPLARAMTGGVADMHRIVEATERHAALLELFSDDELRDHANALRGRLRRGGFEFECVAECFALIRIAAGRTIGQKHYDSQLMAGFALLRGKLAEMATGEGKTFCATLPVCTVALAGYPVHVITVNDYLAKRDAEKMAPLYAFFGLSVGTVYQGLDRDFRRQEYAKSITYGTNKEIAFDYLRDRVAIRGSSSRLHQALKRLSGHEGGGNALVMRGLYFAVVDEADSVFVDEARTPLILSSTGDGSEESKECALALSFARSLTEGVDFRLVAVEHSVLLQDAGRAKLDDFAEEREGDWTSVRAREELIRQALCALYLYKKDQQYVVAEGKVLIVDESTGRVMPDRSWEQGLHQMIEVKESVVLTPRRDTLARVTYQRLFRRYVQLSGMTGTASEAASEIMSVYGLGLVRIPLHRPSRRTVASPRFFADSEDKWRYVAQTAQRLSRHDGRPVLIGTRSVKASEQVSEVLTKMGVAHALLNAKQDALEADLIAAAGLPGRVTVATNMAGRGTDIELGEGVQAKGGLHVILTEYHDSRRVDRQLFGRCARQGDAGSCEAVVSLEDEIFTVYGPALTSMLRAMLHAGIPVPRAVLSAGRVWVQWMAERHHAAIRMQNFKQDRQLDQMLAFTGKGE